MDFVATFAGRKHTDKAEITNPGPDKQFLVSATDIEAAKIYARRFENIALNWDHSIAELKDIRPAQPEETARLHKLSGYEAIFPDR